MLPLVGNYRLMLCIAQGPGPLAVSAWSRGCGVVASLPIRHINDPREAETTLAVRLPAGRGQKQLLGLPP